MVGDSGPRVIKIIKMQKRFMPAVQVGILLCGTHQEFISLRNKVHKGSVAQLLQHRIADLGF